MTSGGDGRKEWRRLGAALAFGAVYDAVFAVAILLCGRPAAALLRLPFPDDPVFLYLNGVLLLLIAAVYAVAAREPERYRAIGFVSAAGRVLGFALFAWAWAGGRPVTFLVLGLADLLIGGCTFLVWRRATGLSD